ncbi:MAG: GNAT family N-acetyltransferase [Tannerellaceae bacterium]|jgi:RimJ/RimL family protein N-acetyltransferase|nr:GNAT family N-acetyltransferase [Tannerellaceae bacterium]
MLSIKKEKFLLRPWQPEDVASLAAQANNIKIWKNTRDSFPYPYTEEDATAYIHHTMSKSPQQDFAIVIDGKAVGGIGVVPLSDVERFSAEVGYWLGESYWNKGIGTQVLIAFSEYLLAHTNLVRLFACVYAYNLPSVRILEKAGFRKVGTLQKAAFKNNRFTDMHYYERVR